MYAAHAGEVPSEAAKNTYGEQLQRAYPFHPLRASVHRDHRDRSIVITRIGPS
jgi:hypothetical protein